MTNHNNERGVSLVELVIVLFIVLVMTAVTVPYVTTSLHNYTLAGAARDVSRIVQLARYTAITQGSNACTVMTGNLFGVDPDCDGALGANDKTIVIPAGVTLTATNPGGGTPIFTGMNFPTNPVAVASPFTITFTARGNVTAAPAIDIIYLTGWGNYSAVTTLGTGRVRSWQYSNSSSSWR